MFHGFIEKIIVASFYGPRYIEGNSVFHQFTCQRQKKEYLIAVFKH